jgi:hypothetical protein
MGSQIDKKAKAISLAQSYIFDPLVFIRSRPSANGPVEPSHIYEKFESSLIKLVKVAQTPKIR